MIERKKLNGSDECKSLTEKYEFLSVNLALSDSEISKDASSLIGEYEQDDVVNLSQEEFNKLMRQLIDQKKTD